MAEIVALGRPFYVVAGGVRVPLPDDRLVTRTGLPICVGSTAPRSPPPRPGETSPPRVLGMSRPPCLARPEHRVDHPGQHDPPGAPGRHAVRHARAALTRRPLRPTRPRADTGSADPDRPLLMTRAAVVSKHLPELSDHLRRRHVGRHRRRPRQPVDRSVFVGHRRRHVRRHARAPAAREGPPSSPPPPRSPSASPPVSHPTPSTTPRSTATPRGSPTPSRRSPMLPDHISHVRRQRRLRVDVPS